MWSCLDIKSRDYRLNPGYEEESSWSPCARCYEVRPPIRWIPEDDCRLSNLENLVSYLWKDEEIDEKLTWEEGSLNSPPQIEGDWRLIGLRRASEELLWRHAWISPGCGGWIGGNGIVISGNNPSDDDIPPLGCSICHQFIIYFFRLTSN